jgi:hypothetical protein
MCVMHAIPVLGTSSLCDGSCPSRRFRSREDRNRGIDQSVSRLAPRLPGEECLLLRNKQQVKSSSAEVYELLTRREPITCEKHQ